ncbi:hypothetical protein G7Y89_g5822 [Cudoniella acicularis]|uniref:Uncharacterized protein n=1 Tax=Cudoniella acicularis TaxID=354080 RepID=A0A8H4RP28_9HELO|nr:hypothetical protein G7Y89_g5822 [Cudoniella acicularis]
MAAPTAYQIQIFNMTNLNRSYVLFQSVSTTPGTPDCFNNAYQKSPLVVSEPSSYAKFNMKNVHFAVYGTSPITLSKGVTVTTCNTVPVTLSSNDTSPPEVAGTQLILPTIEKDGQTPTCGARTQTQKTLPNAYGISCDSSFMFPNSNNICISFGAPESHTGQVIPVATIPAWPSSEFIFEPKAIYYIATGTYTPGAIVSVSELSNVLTVDFTNNPESPSHNAIFTHMSDKSWKPGAPRI